MLASARPSIRAALLVVALVVASGSRPVHAAPAELVGTFALTAGRCDGDATGSTFRMVLPGGSADGPFVSNGDSPCADQTVTPLAPGTDGGLVTGQHQPSPAPAFDEAGNAVARRIIEPTGFFGVRFSASTNPVDPQTGTEVPSPSIAVDGDALSGDLRSFAATWNGQEFNQGAPKPDGSKPGSTALPTGTYDAASGAFTLEWASQIVGGPFDDFTGIWHLEGRFVPAGSPAPTVGEATPVAAGSAEADAATTTVAATSPTTAAPTSTSLTAPPPEDDGTAAPAVATTPPVDGWEAPTWIVVGLTVVTLGALATFVYFARAVRRELVEP